MTENTSVQPAPGRMGLGARFVGVITSPRDTFAAVAANPKWLGMLVVVTVVGALLAGGFYMTAVGQRAYVDKAAEGSFLGPATDAQIQGAEKIAPYMGYIAGGASLVVGPIITVVFAGIAFLIFGVFTGGDAKFKQVFAVMVHSGVIGLVGQAVTTAVSFFRESLDSPMNLSVFFPMLPDGSFLMKFLGMIDVFRVWWVIVLAIGLAVLYKKKTASVATLLFIIYGVIAIGIAAFSAARS